MAVQTVPPIDQLTREQCADLLDELAIRMSKFEPPDWHLEVLDARQSALEAGEAEFLDWEDVKDELRQRIK
jgi:hypothetical protein